MITHDKFMQGVYDFINTYKRLPYLPGDDIEIKFEIEDDNGDVVVKVKPYRANKYIKIFYNSRKNMTKKLLANGLLTYKMIAETLDLSETVVKNIITKSIKNPQRNDRRKLDMFFNEDFYARDLGKYFPRCIRCIKQCKQPYWINNIKCSKYKE